MRILAICWSSYLPLMKASADDLGIDLRAYSTRQAATVPGVLEKIRGDLAAADLVLAYRTNDAFWEELEEDLARAKARLPLVVVGSDPSFMALSNVPWEVASDVYRYLVFNGAQNIRNLFLSLLSRLFGQQRPFTPPVELPWQGIHHPRLNGVFTDREAYLRAYESSLPFTPRAYVGLLYPRTNWVTGNMGVERAVIEALEGRSLGVLPVFLYSLKDGALGNLGGTEVVGRYFVAGGRPCVEGVIKLTAFFLGSGKGDLDMSGARDGAQVFKDLNIPLFNPLISYYRSKEEWWEDPEGLGSQVAWSVAMPEFEGVIEPLVVGAVQGENQEPLTERVGRLAARVAQWVALRKKPAAEKRVAFILHNNPCASVEGTVGGGAHLDTLESVVAVMRRMRKEGYRVEPPRDGKALIEEIMERKAVSEFRWTTVEEIVARGGVLGFVAGERYRRWFDELPAVSREKMRAAWGEPPGEAMVHGGNILVTGVTYGNAVVCVQPKRGCAGARCDGEVCKILHDPAVPPTHQYVATYRWLEEEFKADAVIHVGTHGNLEFLPGKSTGLSAACFPAIAIGAVPHLYIYNADNPAEGTVAKRRSNAVIVDHMQAVMVGAELYGELEELERLLEEHGKCAAGEPARAHALDHMIRDQAARLNLLDEEREDQETTDAFLRRLHEKLTLMKGSSFADGMHVFGEIPRGEKLADFVSAVVGFDDSPASVRGVLRDILSRRGVPEGEDREEAVERSWRDLVRDFVLERTPLRAGLARHDLTADEEARLSRIEETIGSVVENVRASDEIGALLIGLGGGYVEPGPSGLITRGRPDILPTGRNFYSLDPRRIPTPAAWVTGRELAERTLERFLKTEGRYPESLAYYWQCSDIMWSDGEGLAMVMHLLGVKPRWLPNGRVEGFEILPLDEIERPRIDVTVRVSGITRDNFPGCIEFLDEIVQRVAALEEPPEGNFVRKHTLEKLKAAGLQGEDVAPGVLRPFTYRIFAAMPGTYQAGTQLAVYASAWRTERDLADVFLRWNGYAYGKGVFGAPAHEGLKTSLKDVEVTFNKVVTDEYDLTGCCGYFGTHGGMINAARVLTGREVRNYYGDTRKPRHVSVRTLTEEIRRVARAKILNPRWIEGMKRHGYRGASEISKRVGRLYGWQATAKAVDGAVFDDVARTFVIDARNRRFFADNNPWALEEMTRRLIEAAERGLWEPAPDVREALKAIYLEIEGWIEEKMENADGDFQGGSIDVFTRADVAAWREKWEEME